MSVSVVMWSAASNVFDVVLMLITPAFSQSWKRSGVNVSPYQVLQTLAVVTPDPDDAGL